MSESCAHTFCIYHAIMLVKTHFGGWNNKSEQRASHRTDAQYPSGTQLGFFFNISTVKYSNQEYHSPRCCKSSKIFVKESPLIPQQTLGSMKKQSE